MHRIDAPGFAPGNLFTEGNPALSILATEVSDDWLNDVQEEIVNVILGQGIALVKGTQDQLNDALLAMIGGGGTNLKLDPLLNNTVDQVIAGLIFDKTVFKAAVINFDIHRSTDSSNVQETGILVATHDTKDDVWRVQILISALDDAGCTFNITSTGQIRITSDNLAGASYLAQLRISGIQRFAL